MSKSYCSVGTAFPSASKTATPDRCVLPSDDVIANIHTTVMNYSIHVLAYITQYTHIETAIGKARVYIYTPSSVILYSRDTEPRPAKDLEGENIVLFVH